MEIMKVENVRFFDCALNAFMPRYHTNLKMTFIMKTTKVTILEDTPKMIKANPSEENTKMMNLTP